LRWLWLGLRLGLRLRWGLRLRLGLRLRRSYFGGSFDGRFDRRFIIAASPKDQEEDDEHGYDSYHRNCHDSYLRGSTPIGYWRRAP
jgi:hypothetical protein